MQSIRTKRPRLNLGHPFMEADELPGAGAGAGHLLDGNAFPFQQPCVATKSSIPANTSCPSFVDVGHHLQMAIVTLQTDETQAGPGGDVPGQCQSGLAGRDAAAAHADVHLDQDADG